MLLPMSSRLNLSDISWCDKVVDKILRWHRTGFRSIWQTHAILLNKGNLFNLYKMVKCQFGQSVLKFDIAFLKNAKKRLKKVFPLNEIVNHVVKVTQMWRTVIVNGIRFVSLGSH